MQVVACGVCHTDLGYYYAQVRVDPSDNLWVVDTVDHTVQQLSPTGAILLTIGTISYSLYLVHYCVAVGVWRSDSWPEWVAQALLLIGCSVIAAVATYSWIEAPFVRLGRKIRLMPLPESTDRS